MKNCIGHCAGDTFGQFPEATYPTLLESFVIPMPDFKRQVGKKLYSTTQLFKLYLEKGHNVVL